MTGLKQEAPQVLPGFVLWSNRTLLTWNLIYLQSPLLGPRHHCPSFTKFCGGRLPWNTSLVDSPSVLSSLYRCLLLLVKLQSVEEHLQDNIDPWDQSLHTAHLFLCINKYSREIQHERSWKEPVTGTNDRIPQFSGGIFTRLHFPSHSCGGWRTHLRGRPGQSEVVLLFLSFDLSSRLGKEVCL